TTMMSASVRRPLSLPEMVMAAWSASMRIEKLPAVAGVKPLAASSRVWLMICAAQPAYRVWSKAGMVFRAFLRLPALRHMTMRAGFMPGCRDSVVAALLAVVAEFLDHAGHLGGGQVAGRAQPAGDDVLAGQVLHFLGQRVGLRQGLAGR